MRRVLGIAQVVPIGHDREYRVDAEAGPEQAEIEEVPDLPPPEQRHEQEESGDDARDDDDAP